MIIDNVPVKKIKFIVAHAVKDLLESWYADKMPASVYKQTTMLKSRLIINGGFI